MKNMGLWFFYSPYFYKEMGGKGMELNVILQTVIQNLETVGLCLVLLILFRVSEILFGIALAKKDNIAFDW